MSEDTVDREITGMEAALKRIERDLQHLKGYLKQLKKFTTPPPHPLEDRQEQPTL